MILLARVLERAGVRTRVFATSFMKSLIGDNIMVSPILVKEYGVPLDLNKLAIYTSDKRFFRFHSFNAFLGWFKENGDLEINHGMTGMLSNSEIYQMMPRVKNYYQYEMDRGKFQKQTLIKDL